MSRYTINGLLKGDDLDHQSRRVISENSNGDASSDRIPDSEINQHSITDSLAHQSPISNEYQQHHHHHHHHHHQLFSYVSATLISDQLPSYFSENPTRENERVVNSGEIQEEITHSLTPSPSPSPFHFQTELGNNPHQQPDSSETGNPPSNGKLT